jgi:hypothetical protein
MSSEFVDTAFWISEFLLFGLVPFISVLFAFVFSIKILQALQISIPNWIKKSMSRAKGFMKK